MQIKVLSQVYRIYDLREDGSLVQWWPKPLFESEQAAIDYVKRQGVETGNYVIRMES